MRGINFPSSTVEPTLGPASPHPSLLAAWRLDAGFSLCGRKGCWGKMTDRLREQRPREGQLANVTGQSTAEPSLLIARPVLSCCPLRAREVLPEGGAGSSGVCGNLNLVIST